jgi:hypothetical protein
MATRESTPMTPAAALARHLEWLEYALTAAREEQDRRRGRLDKSTPKNRDKRTIRLAEVSAEVDELAALVQGIKDIQAAAAKPSGRAASKAPAGRRRSTKASTTKAASSRRSPATSGRRRSGGAAASGTKPAAARGTQPAAASADTTAAAVVRVEAPGVVHDEAQQRGQEARGCPEGTRHADPALADATDRLLELTGR